MSTGPDHPDHPDHPTCAHCGLPAPPPPDGESAFCCSGCATVFHLMQDTGLGSFYALRDRLGDAPSGQPVEADAVAEAERAYALYDDPAFLARYSRPHGATTQRIELYVQHVHCAACVWVMDQLPGLLDGVVEARLDFGTRRLRLVWDPSRVQLSHVGAFLARIGYPTHPMGAEADTARKKEERAELFRIGVAGALAGNVMLISIALYAGAFGGMDPAFHRFFEWASLLLTLPAVTWAAWPFYRGAWAGLRLRRAHMDLPLSLGLIGGSLMSAWATFTHAGVGYYDTLCTLVFLILLGRFLQTRGQRSAMTGTELLDALTPRRAYRQAGESFQAVPIDALREGDTVRVRSGEVFPADGAISSGQTHADLSLLTGESAPRPVTAGEPVFAGTLNVGDEVHVTVSRSGAETRLGRLAELIEQAGAARAPVVQLADRISGWFVAAVLVIATVGALVWSRLDPTRVFDVLMAVLVVSCPCALGLATPVALAVARGRAARRGILVKSTAAIEALAKVRHLVLDKTGTLTEGRLGVTHAELDPALAAELAALEARSSHPAARAVTRWALSAAASTDAPAVRDVTEHPGRGLEGSVDGHRWRVGSVGWLGAPAALQAPLDAALTRGESPIVLERDGAVVGLLALGDAVRPDTADALARLRAEGLALSIRSGDHPRVVASLAARLGIDEAHGGVPPEAKADGLSGRADVAMVGDGINDAAALRAAAVGLAVAGGAEAAMQVADVYLTRPGLTPVAELVVGARRTLAVIRRNVLFSLGYNVLFVTLALLGFVTPLAAAVLMPLSSLTVIGSSVFGRTFPDAPEAAPQTGAFAGSARAGSGSRTTQAAPA